MARSFCYSVFAGGILTACVVLGSPDLSLGQSAAPDAPAAPKSTAKPPQIAEVDAAVELFKVRNFDGAQKQLEEAVRKHPELPPANIIMAQLFAQANQAYLMRMALEKAIVSTPDDPEAYVILGNIALPDRRVTEAALLFEKAQTLLAACQNVERKKIMEPQILSGLASVAEAREKWEEAQKDLESLLKLIPEAKDQAMPLVRLARALFQQKKAAEAYNKLKDAYKADPTNVLTPEAALGRFYEQFGDPENAKKWMATALTRYPEDLRTRLAVGQWALETGKLTEAETHATKAKQLSATSLEAMILRGIVALFKKDYATAEKEFTAAKITSPDNFAATNNLALALCEQKDDQKKRQAVENATTNFRQYPKNAEAASTLGWTLYKVGRLDEAEQAFRQAAQSGNLSQDTAYYIAQISYDRVRKEEAKNLLDAALKGDRPFSMRPEALALQDKLNKDPSLKKDTGTTGKKGN
jgi:tetratricopeptide (TPR) repeat protein